MPESLVFNKVAGWPATLLKTRDPGTGSGKFLRTPLHKEHLGWLLLAFPDMVLRNRENRNYS